MPRAQCIVTRGNRILMAKHSAEGQEWWCLPGGGIEPGEQPSEAALRELEEECLVSGQILRRTAVGADLDFDDAAYTFHVDIGDAEPTLGEDPDLPSGQEQVLRDIRWLTLAEIPERDRAFLWSAGLLAVPGFWKEVEKWGNDASYPSRPLTVTSPITGYIEVDSVLESLLAHVRAILGGNLVGLYLYGSLATGGFEPESSDIDFLAATFAALGEGEVAALKEMHEALRLQSKWGHKLEGAYMPLDDLRRYDPGTHHLFLSEDTPFGLHPLDVDWVINRHVLREKGIVVFGPSPALLVDPVSPSQLSRAVGDLLDGSWKNGLQSPAFLSTRRYQAFAILTMCRALHALEEGKFVSKLDAASWACRTLEPRWAPLIRTALRWQADHDPDEAGLGDTLRFISYSIDRSHGPH